MIVKILKTDDRLGIKAGETYYAKRYQYDPIEKITLTKRVSDGHDPECNQYMREVAHLLQNQWMIINDDGEYVPEVSP